MTFFLLYVVLLILWVPLLWPALRLGGWSRFWLLVVAAAGLAAALHEARMLLGTTASIRLDIVAIGFALLILYATAAVVLFRARWRRMAGLLALVLVLAGGGMSYEWTRMGREGERLTQIFHARNALLFDAKFRSQAIYESHFGPFEGADEALPTGHWQAPSGSNYPRLIVNGEGRVWLFYRCGETECPYGPAGSGLQRLGGDPEKTWQATLEPRVGAPLTLRLTEERPDRLSVEVRGQPLAFARTPPPVDPAPPAETLVFLGSFAKLACRGQHARLHQLWLWRQDTRLYGVGVFTTLVAGRRADFVSPAVLGEGSNDGDAWRFDWQINGQPWTAALALTGPDAVLTLAGGGQDPERIALTPGAVFQDETVALAPLTGAADWHHWFDIVLVGHFFSGDIPAC
ncbi:MAG: hypothetical protein OEM59_07660 [Rhodospirillales bacterium]|nr:hypothetical protein [Rhodospirillales bacterium]